MSSNKILLRAWGIILIIYFIIAYCDFWFKLGFSDVGPCDIYDTSISGPEYDSEGQGMYKLILNITYGAWYGNLIQDMIMIETDSYHIALKQQRHVHGTRIDNCCPKFYPLPGIFNMFTSEYHFYGMIFGLSFISCVLVMISIYFSVRHEKKSNLQTKAAPRRLSVKRR